MSDLTLIRAGHTEVGCGICGYCGDEWPCDTGVVLAALAAAEARAEQAERERDAARRRVWTLRPALDLAVKRLREIEPSYRDYHEGGEIWRVIEIGARAMDETSGPLGDAPKDDDNARLRERLAAVEAALSRLRAGCMVPSGLSCRLCHGTWLSEDGETAADHHDGCPLLETAQGAALAATPARTPDLCALCDRPREPDDDWCSECRAGVDAAASPFAAPPAADEPAELSMIRAGDELVREIDAALDGDGFDATAPRVRFENVAEVIEWLESDDDAATPAAGEVE